MIELRGIETFYGVASPNLDLDPEPMALPRRCGLAEARGLRQA
jgi:hypothetical protein